MDRIPSLLHQSSVHAVGDARKIVGTRLDHDRHRNLASTVELGCNIERLDGRLAHHIEIRRVGRAFATVAAHQEIGLVVVGHPHSTHICIHLDRVHPDIGEGYRWIGVHHTIHKPFDPIDMGTFEPERYRGIHREVSIVLHDRLGKYRLGCRFENGHGRRFVLADSIQRSPYLDGGCLGNSGSRDRMLEPVSFTHTTIGGTVHPFTVEEPSEGVDRGSTRCGIRCEDAVHLIGDESFPILYPEIKFGRCPVLHLEGDLIAPIRGTGIGSFRHQGVGSGTHRTPIEIRTHGNLVQQQAERGRTLFVHHWNRNRAECEDHTILRVGNHRFGVYRPYSPFPECGKTIGVGNHSLHRIQVTLRETGGERSTGITVSDLVLRSTTDVFGPHHIADGIVAGSAQ